MRLRKRIGRWCLTAVLAACVASALPALAASVPFWGAKTSVSADTPIGQLKHGEWLWMGNAMTTGPILVVVSINEQRAYVYRNGVMIGATTVSTGRSGYATPTGVFTTLQKQEEHRSTIYDGAPMPYMQRLTWSGVALHAGGLPGFPESHGCVHLPSAFAKLLYDVSPPGMTVVIAGDSGVLKEIAHPGFLAPVSSTGVPLDTEPLSSAQIERWEPQVSPTGPLSLVLSRASARIIVYRNGVEIGRARLRVRDGPPFGTHVLILAEGASHTADSYVPDATKYRWLQVAVPGHATDGRTELSATAIARIEMPPDFVSRVRDVLSPGAVVLVTDEPVTPATSGAPLQVINADPPH